MNACVIVFTNLNYVFCCKNVLVYCYWNNLRVDCVQHYYFSLSIALNPGSTVIVIFFFLDPEDKNILASY